MPILLDFSQLSGQDPNYLAALGIAEIDVLMATDDGYNVTGAHLGSVGRGYDTTMRPCIVFSMRGEGVRRFSGLTTEYSPTGQMKRRLGILLDNELLTAPSIQETIHGSGQITGQFSADEVEFVVAILEAGALPVMLVKEPVIEEDFPADPSARQTVRSIAVSGFVVLVFGWFAMSLRYKWLGAVAGFSTVSQVTLALGMLLVVKASFTVSVVSIVMLVAILATGCHALMCEVIRRERDAIPNSPTGSSSAQPIYLLTAAVVGSFYLLICSAGTVVYPFGGFNFAVRIIALAVVVSIGPDGRRVETGSSDKTFSLWDLSAEDPAKSARVVLGDNDGAAAISPDGRWLVINQQFQKWSPSVGLKCRGPG